MRDFPEIPDFLRVENRDLLPVSDTCPTPVGQRRRKTANAQRFDLPKTMSPEAWELLRQIEKQKADKLKAKFKALRERAKR